MNLQSVQSYGSIQDNANNNSCIVQCTKKLQLMVPPLYCNDIKTGVIYSLKRATQGYCKELGGLVISYKNIQVEPRSGWIHGTNPFLHLHIRATFDVFTPTKGFCIEGVVNEVSNKKVSFLVYKKFNVVYRTNDVRSKLTRAAKLKGPNAATARTALNYVNSITPSLKEGDSCTLLLQEVDFLSYIPHIRGFPVPKDLDTSGLLSEDIEQFSETCIPSTADTSTSRKVRFSDQESETSEMADTSINILTPPVSHGDRTSDSDDEPASVAAESPTSKKRKKRRAQEDDTDIIKLEKLTPPKMLDLPDLSLPSLLCTDGAASPALSKKKKKKRAQEAETDVIKLERLSPPRVLDPPQVSKSRKRKHCDDSEQIDSVEVLKPSKKKRKVNAQA